MRDQAEKYLKEVIEDFPSLILNSCKDGFAEYSGTIAFRAKYDDFEEIEDEYDVDITLPLSDTEILPSAKETGQRIPIKGENHINPDGSMCLGAPLQVRQKFRRNPTLSNFIKNLLIPFLYAISFKEKHGYMPFGELSHGSKGIFEYYKELLEIDSDYSVLEFLKIIVEDNYRGHIICPCKSGERLRNCHGPLILEIKDQQSRNQFLYDLSHCYQAYKDSGGELPKKFWTKRLKDYVNKISPSSKRNTE